MCCMIVALRTYSCLLKDHVQACTYVICLHINTYMHAWLQYFHGDACWQIRIYTYAFQRLLGREQSYPKICTCACMPLRIYIHTYIYARVCVYAHIMFTVHNIHAYNTKTCIPAFSSSWIMSSLPHSAAKCRGVSPNALMYVTLCKIMHVYVCI